MAVITYETFRDRLRARLWPTPPGEPASLRPAHNAMFQQALHETQKWVRSLKLNNVTIIAACATLIRNGISIMEAPYGRYNRVYVITAGRHEDPVYYDQTSYDEILRFSGAIMETGWANPPHSSPALELGVRYNNEVADSTVGRTRSGGKYAIHQKRLYVAPYIQSYEEVVIDWNGEKREWSDADTLDETYWTMDVELAIQAFVKWRHESDFGCMKPQEKRALKQEFDDALAEAIYQDDMRLKINPRTDPELISRSPIYYETYDDLY